MKKAVDEFKEKLAKALRELKEAIEEEGAIPVYISGGKAYRLSADETAEEFTHSAAEPYAWKLAHDVRPARWSNGTGGCYECHYHRFSDLRRRGDGDRPRTGR